MTTDTLENVNLRLSRTYKASCDRVFAAWSSAENLKQWFCPGDKTVAAAAADFKVGGSYRITMQEPNGDQYTCLGIYKEIIENKKIVMSWNWFESGDPDSLLTIEFDENNGETTVTIIHVNLPNEQIRDMHIEGWEGCLENLEKKFLS